MFSPHPSPFAPISGTSPSPRGLFIKKWGTLTVPSSDGECSSADNLIFYDGAVEAMFRAARANWHLYVIGNEDDVAFGRLTLAEYERTREHFGRHLESFGIQVDRDYSCVDNPEGVAGRCNDSVYLLPNTGAFFHAAHTDGISLKHSWVVGDDTSSLVAGWRAGLRTAAVGTGAGMQDNVYDVQPHLEAEDFATLIHEFLGAQAAALR